MLESFTCCYALLGIIDKDLAKKVQEELVEVVVLRDNFLEPPHSPHKFSRLTGCIRHGILQMSILEEAGC